jgi:hypothetical protein
MDPRTLDPDLHRLPRMGHAAPYASSAVMARRAAPPAPGPDPLAASPAEAARLRCAAALLALLGAIGLQAAQRTASLLMAGGGYGTPLLVGAAAWAAALPILGALRSRWEQERCGRASSAYEPLDRDRVVVASAAALAMWWVSGVIAGAGPSWAGAPARGLADLLSLLAMYRGFVPLLDTRRVGLGAAACWRPLVLGLAPSLGPTVWAALRWLLERR